VRKAGNSVIVAFENESEDEDWDDGTGWMGSLMSLRSELLRGDLAAFISDGFFACRMKSSPRTDRSQRCLLDLANCSLPFIR
jgi:hypothetical protein